jgi:hypothetical protein
MLMSALFYRGLCPEYPGTFKRQGWGLSNGRGGEGVPEYAKNAIYKIIGEKCTSFDELYESL